MRDLTGASALVAVLIIGACAASANSPGAEVPGTPEDPNMAPHALGWAGASPEAQRATALAEVGEARRALDLAGDACGNACPPLVELRKGVRHLCRVDETKDDVKACKEARVALLADETHLRPLCGTCVPHNDVDDAGPDSDF